ncbi:unnamed protein product [Schistocephalus solidus]|uniref:Uncharacterized protein n=1 Tax=Schistocephalus solidus TaxID=70667 RepID=A0A3P7BRZ7_SCHSO|nr:unnamed protein product [Schistocephalus solidus]
MMIESGSEVSPLCWSTMQSAISHLGDDLVTSTFPSRFDRVVYADLLLSHLHCGYEE